MQRKLESISKRQKLRFSQLNSQKLPERDGVSTSLTLLEEHELSNAFSQPIAGTLIGMISDHRMPAWQRQETVSSLGYSLGNSYTQRLLDPRKPAIVGQMMLQRQSVMELGWSNVPARQITLEFVPDEKIEKIKQKRYPLGVIHARVKNEEVMQIDARGGHPIEGKIADKRNPGRTYGATTAGRFQLAEGKSHVSRGSKEKDPWQFSQIAWGTPLKDDDPQGGVLYKSKKGRWHSTMRLRVPIERDTIIAAEAELGRPKVVPATWDLNDFGKLAFRIEGSNGDFIHTTPPNEEQYAKGLEEKLQFSHGCIHIKPSDRDMMIDLGLLRGGVRVIVHKYRSKEQWGTPR